MTPTRRRGDHPTLRVHARVKPGSSKGPLVITGADGTLELFVREPAVDGKANNAAIALLAHHYGVPPGAVRLVGGASSRHKRFDIDQPTPQQ